MVKSKYISDILELILDGDENALCARKQIQFITDEEFIYTGSGLFVYFSHSDEIYKYKLANDFMFLGNVRIKSTEYNLEADATLYSKNGLIDNLEIWCYSGDVYPKRDLTKYTLTQFWKNSPNKIITRK